MLRHFDLQCVIDRPASLCVSVNPLSTSNTKACDPTIRSPIRSHHSCQNASRSHIAIALPQSWVTMAGQGCPPPEIHLIDKGPFKLPG